MTNTNEDRVRALELEVADLTKALTGLTCGGSEFFIQRGDRFVADIPACVAWVRRAKQDAHRGRVDAIIAKRDAEASLTAAQERAERLEAALNAILHTYDDGGIPLGQALKMANAALEKQDKPNG